MDSSRSRFLGQKRRRNSHSRYTSLSDFPSSSSPSSSEQESTSLSHNENNNYNRNHVHNNDDDNQYSEIPILFSHDFHIKFRPDLFFRNEANPSTSLPSDSSVFDTSQANTENLNTNMNSVESISEPLRPRPGDFEFGMDLAQFLWHLYETKYLTKATYDQVLLSLSLRPPLLTPREILKRKCDIQGILWRSPHSSEVEKSSRSLIASSSPSDSNISGVENSNNNQIIKNVSLPNSITSPNQSINNNSHNVLSANSLNNNNTFQSTKSKNISRPVCTVRRKATWAQDSTNISSLFTGAECIARKRRIELYRSYSYYPKSQAGLSSSINANHTDDPIFGFASLHNVHPRPSIMHFQLRHHLSPVSGSEVYFIDSQNHLRLLDPRRNMSCIAVDTSNIKITSMAASKDVIVAGGFFGNYILKSRSEFLSELPDISYKKNFRPQPTAKGTITIDQAGITNHVHITSNPISSLSAVFASNDFTVRELDIETEKFKATHKFDFPINASATSPNGTLRCITGDSLETLLIDTRSGLEVCKLLGHKDHVFDCVFSPNGYNLATGAQDLTTRIWDLRYISTNLDSISDTKQQISDASMLVFGAQFGAFRALSYNDSGRFLAMAEPADYVHIVDTSRFDSVVNYRNRLSNTSLKSNQISAHRGQILTFWGEITGIGFKNDTLWIGNSDYSAGGLMQYRKASYLM